MNDKQQLAAMGEDILQHIKSESDKNKHPVTMRVYQSDIPALIGVNAGKPTMSISDLVNVDVQPLRMAKRIEELEAQVRVMAEALREARQHINGGPGIKCGLEFRDMFERIDVALAGKLPSQHPDDAAVDRFAVAMKAKLAAARAKGRSGWDDPAACSVEFLADLLVSHVGKGNPGNFEDIANLAMMLHQRGADPAVLVDHIPVPAEPEGWQLVPVDVTLPMQNAYFNVIDQNMNRVQTDLCFGRYDSSKQAYRAMLAAAPKPEGGA